jgi:hypothetical protein
MEDGWLDGISGNLNLVYSHHPVSERGSKVAVCRGELPLARRSWITVRGLHVGHTR